MSTPAATVRLFRVVALAVAIAAPAEGLRRAAYYDPVGILTVCYGSTENVKQGEVSLAECHARLTSDMIKAIDTVERCVPGLPDHMLAAWSDAVFNLGPRIVCSKETSRAARLLSMGEFTLACNELPRWNMARVAGVLVPLPGLTDRREREKALCLSGTV